MSQSAHISTTHTVDAVIAPQMGVEVAQLEKVTPLQSLIETTKPRITRLVTITSGVGFMMAAVTNPAPWWQLAIAAAGCVVGTALSAAGANAINQYMERDRDAMMPRTINRPLPQGRLEPKTVLWAGIGLGVAGCLVLAMMNGAIPAVVSLACIVSYVVFYTPMKTRSALATFVGAIPGALPPLIGWTAASQTKGWGALLEPGGIALFTLMFIWQIPHFLAIAWMYRDDYAKGGYMVLPVIDPKGTVTAATIGLWTAALIPATILPAVVMPDLLGSPYLWTAGISGALFVILAARLVLIRGRSEARQVFFASIAHLPLILMVMVGEAVIRAYTA